MSKQHMVVKADQLQTFSALSKEYKELTEKAPLQSGVELDATMIRLRGIDHLLREAEAAVPRWTGGSSNYKNALGNNIMQEIEINAICTNLIIKSWWARWLPFGWMHSLAASYYARKARRLYANKVIAQQLNKLNGSI